MNTNSTVVSPTTAVVTGAGGGLGRAFCLELARRPVRLLLADVHGERCEETARLVVERGSEARAVVADVSDAAAVEHLAALADTYLGHIDLVINNAGVAAAGEIGEASLENWHWIMGINLWGVIHGCHFFVPRLKRQGSGAILNVASLAGIASAPSMGPYNVTKAAVISLSETLRAELAAHGVRVTVLCPTFFRTNLMETLRTANAEQRAMAAAVFAQSKGSAEAVARQALQAVERGQLYCLPSRDARAVWRIKRLLPHRFAQLLGSRRLAERARRAGSDRSV